MIAEESKPGRRWCRGYAEFTRMVLEDSEFRDWTQELFDHVDEAARNPDEATERLVRLQHQLVELVDLLDPDRMRFPASERTLFDSGRAVSELEPYRPSRLGSPPLSDTGGTTG
jgi:hypothetical protein